MLQLVLILLLIALSPLLLIALVARGSRAYNGGADDSYPYYRKMKTIEDVREAFEYVRQFRLKLVSSDYKIINMPDLTPAQRKFRGRSLVVEFDESDYTRMNWLSDWFNERCRLRCKRYDEPDSPLDLWEKEGSAYANQLDGSVESMMRVNNKFYQKVRGCNNFRPSLARGLIRATGARSQLDISAGWGDRLIGALAAGIRYVGVDPNECVHPGYDEIIQTLGTDAPQPLLIQSPFETAELPAETYDLIMTSPPYFDLEVYSAAETQSISRFGAVDAWLDGFLMPSLAKAWERLNPGGYMIIIINIARGGRDYVSDMLQRARSFEQCEYLGLLPYGTKIERPRPGQYQHKSPQPMWIWQKKATVSIEPLMAEHAPALATIASDPEVMSHIAAGRTWDIGKIQELARYGNDDSYMHWVIKYGAIVVGYVGLYPLDTDRPDDGLQFRIFLNSLEQGRGYGREAVRLVIETYSGGRRLYMQAHDGNTASVRLAAAAGFTPVEGQFAVGRTPVLRFVYQK